MDVWVPWRAQPSRIPAFDFCTAWWDANDFDVQVVDSGDDPFSLAASRNEAVDRSSGPVVIADADTIPASIEQVHEAIGQTLTLGRTVIPYTEYRSLGASTAAALAGAALADLDHFHWPPACSGIFVTTPAVWWAYGGQDPRFKGWGMEDVAHQVAHRTLIGELGRVDGVAYALGHEPERKLGSQYEANQALYQRYSQAAEDPARMRALIGEH